VPFIRTAAFKSGAFVSGEPVQPVVLKYPFDFFAPSWETILIRTYLWKLWAGLRFRIQAQWLPLYVPNEQEKADPALYASNVRAYMSKMSGVPLCESGIAQKAAYHKAIMGGKVRIDEQIEYL
jgi:lysophosphatidylcholine acyltransferase / lyso-PAF acetyltransferase